MLDYQTSKLEVSRIKKVHSEIVEFLREIDSDFHEIPARNLALRIENNILLPVRYALSIIETIQTMGPEHIPDLILQKWNVSIFEALELGGVEFEF